MMQIIFQKAAKNQLMKMVIMENITKILYVKTFKQLIS